MTENDDIKHQLQANQLAWCALVEELYHSGVLNKQNLKNRIDSDMWLDCKDELSVYSQHLQFLDIHSSKNTYESAFNQNDGNTNQGIINSPNSNISNSFNQGGFTSIECKVFTLVFGILAWGLAVIADLLVTHNLIASIIAGIPAFICWCFCLGLTVIWQCQFQQKGNLK